MKKLSFLLIVLTIISASCNCSKETTSMSDFSVKEVEGFKINNDPISESKTSYSIVELKDFFMDNQDIIYLNDINDRFSVEYFREIQSSNSYYIVFPVSEGGKFLIFLYHNLNLETYQKKLCYSDYMYVIDLPDEKAFSSVDLSYEYDDVKSLAPCTQLVTSRSSSVVSYSPLIDGNVMMCTYERAVSQSLKVTGLEVLHDGDYRFPYKDMILGDLIE